MLYIRDWRLQSYAFDIILNVVFHLCPKIPHTGSLNVAQVSQECHLIHYSNSSACHFVTQYLIMCGPAVTFYCIDYFIWVESDPNGRKMHNSKTQHRARTIGSHTKTHGCAHQGEVFLFLVLLVPGPVLFWHLFWGWCWCRAGGGRWMLREERPWVGCL